MRLTLDGSDKSELAESELAESESLDGFGMNGSLNPSNMDSRRYGVYEMSEVYGVYEVCTPHTSHNLIFVP